MDKTYILDTSVIIDNPECIDILRNGEENAILIPYSVILELDGLKRKADLAYIISDIATRLENDPGVTFIMHEDVRYGDLDIGDEHIFDDILRYLKKLDAEGRERTIVVSNDRFFRIRLNILGVNVQAFKSSHPIVSESQMYTGFTENGGDPLPNSFQWIEGKPFYHGRQPHTVDHENRPWNIYPRTVYQNLALELMLDPDVDIVTLQSQAGYGKTYLALAAAFELVLNKPKQCEKIYIVKPNIEIGEKIGFLPGEIDEKLAPYFKPIEELMLKLHELRPANRLYVDSTDGKYTLNPKKCEILPLNYVRGMNLENCVVIIDEAQNLTRLQTRTLLTRMGHGVTCFVLGDTEQVDHPYLNRYNNGLNWIVKSFKGMTNYGHMVLKGPKSRGPITDMVLSSNL